MSMRSKNKSKIGTRGRSEAAPWFWPRVLRRRLRKMKGVMPLFKKMVRRLPRPEVRNLSRHGKMRGLDGTMLGPYRSRGT